MERFSENALNRRDMFGYSRRQVAGMVKDGDTEKIPVLAGNMTAMGMRVYKENLS